MSIKFLTPYGPYPANSIVTLDAATEAALVADKVATTTLTGGVAYTPASNGASSPAAQAYASSVSVAGRAIDLVLFGTSLTKENWLGPNSVTLDTAQNTLSARGHLVAANLLLGSPFRFVRNAGKSGDTITDMLNRFQTDVAPYLAGGKGLTIEFGLNELPLIVGGATDPTAADSLSKFDQIVPAAFAAGAQFIIVTTMPPSSLHMTGANIGARNNYMQQVNAGLIQRGRANPRIIVSDIYSTLVDSSSVYPAYRSGTSYDTHHWNCNGAMEGGRTIAADLIAANVIPQSIRTAASPSDFKNLVFNPLALGNNASGTNGTTIGTGMTGNGPNGWTSLRTGTATAASSVVSRATAGYNDLKQGQFARMAVTGGALNDLVGWRWTLGTSGVNWSAGYSAQVGRVRMPTTPNGLRAVCIATSGVGGGTEPVWPTTAGATVVDGGITWAMQDVPVPGDTIEVSLDFGLSGWTGTALVEAQVSFTGSSYVINGNLVFAGDAPPTFVPATGTIAMSGTMPAGATNATLTVYCAASAGATGNFDLAGVSVRITNR